MNAACIFSGNVCPCQKGPVKIGLSPGVTPFTVAKNQFRFPPFQRWLGAGCTSGFLKRLLAGLPKLPGGKPVSLLTINAYILHMDGVDNTDDDCIDGEIFGFGGQPGT